MEIISKAYAPVLKVLKRFQKRTAQGRWMKYCVRENVEDGILIHNLMTRELLLLTEAEAQDPTALDYLWERWFVVPAQTNEKELVDFLRIILENSRGKNQNITDYTIYTTTDCNARCFYCFQHGTAKINMTLETAEKVVRFIRNHCGGKKVRIQWFGGEPLLNVPVIDTICAGLHQAGLDFESNLTTNGYLLSDEIVRKAAEVWNVNRVQVALDGTEKVYNRAKAYVDVEGSPYQVVLENMGRLQDAGITVVVRLNLDLYNAGDLMNLVDDLGNRFAGHGDIRIYVAHLFRQDQPMADLHTPAGWNKREQALNSVEMRIAQWGMTLKQGIRKILTSYQCKADCGSYVTITPTGHVGVCEHYTDSEFVGHVDRDQFDPEMVASWQESLPAYPECADCCHYPECKRLKKCPENKCFDQARAKLLRDKQRMMRNEYGMWKEQETAFEDEDD